MNTRFNHGWLDNNRGGTTDQGQFGHQGECAISESECFT